MTQPVDNQSFQIAGTFQPLDASTTPTLQKADKAIFHALEFWTWVIRQYPGPGLLQSAIQNQGVRGQDQQNISDAVGQAYPTDPVAYLGLPSTFFRFPCLAVYRKDSKYEKHSAGYYHDRCTFDLLYILPPLLAGQAEVILPILRAVEMAIRQKTVQSFDPLYIPPGGTVYGESPWGLKYAAIEEIGFTSGSRGNLPVGNITFPFLQMSGYFLERDMPLAAQNKFTGGDITASLANWDGTVINPFVQAATQAAPTLTKLTPATGTIAGGTGVTLTGTLFQNGATVLIGTQPATSVVRVSATSITCVTPSVGGTGVLDVRVTNPDGQSATLSQSFSFV